MTPSRSSNSATCWLKAGCATWTTEAAREKLPASTILTKYRSWRNCIVPPRTARLHHPSPHDFRQDAVSRRGSAHRLGEGGRVAGPKACCRERTLNDAVVRFG